MIKQQTLQLIDDLKMKQIMAAEKQSQKMLEEAFRGIGYNIDKE